MIAVHGTEPGIVHRDGVFQRTAAMAIPVDQKAEIMCTGVDILLWNLASAPYCRAVDGSNCIRPIEPRGETASHRKFDSVATMLFTKAVGTPYFLDADAIGVFTSSGCPLVFRLRRPAVRRGRVESQELRIDWTV